MVRKHSRGHKPKKIHPWKTFKLDLATPGPQKKVSPKVNSLIKLAGATSKKVTPTQQSFYGQTY